MAKTHKSRQGISKDVIGYPQSETNRTLNVPVAGQTPYVGPNGNWWIGGVDTGEPSVGEQFTPQNASEAFGI